MPEDKIRNHVKRKWVLHIATKRDQDTQHKVLIFRNNDSVETYPINEEFST
jgi:hypothetical protein